MSVVVAWLLRRLLVAVGGVVIVVALALGTFRLLLAQLPAYQAELKAWVDDTLGLELGFDRLDVRLGLRGPELTFYDVAVTSEGQSEPFLVAERAAVVVAPWTALTERELRVSRLQFDGTHLTLERGADGILRLQGAPAGQARADLALRLPLEVEVAVRDSSVIYVDRGLGVDWSFGDVALSLRRRDDVLQLEATADPPDALASRVELAAQQSLVDGRSMDSAWRVFGELGGVDVAVLAAALPDLAPARSRGRGDVSLWLEFGADGLDRGMIDADLSDVAWAAVAGPDPVGYEHVDVSAEWQRQDEGWRLLVDRIDVMRNGRTWPRGGNSTLDVRRDAIALRSDFLRLEDLTPVVQALPQSSATLRWLELAPRGDVTDVDVDLARNDIDGWRYTVASGFDRLGLDPWGRWPGFEGLSGSLRADPSSGRLDLASGDAAFAWPRLFRAPLDVEELAGLVVWREGFDAVRVVSDDLALRSSDGAVRSNLELTLPLDGSSPQLDLQLEIDSLSAVAAKRYLPVHAMRPAAVAWIDNAIQGGRFTGGTAELVGPLRAFPFDDGEGLFRADLEVEDGVLEFVNGWPRAENLDGTITFRNAGFVARGSGRVLGNVSDDVDVGIANLRDPVLTVRAASSGPLADVLRFLNESPLIARYLGPGYARLEAPAGTGDVSVDLALPLTDLPSFDLTASLDISGGELAVDGFGPRAADIHGRLTLADGAVAGDGIEAAFLDGPVTVAVSRAVRDGYRARLDVDGEVTADAAAEAFGLPIEDYVAGQTRWSGTLLIPEQRGEVAAAPFMIGVESNLTGVALNFPAPFEKPPAAATTLQIDLAFDADGLGVEGHLGASRRFALDFASGDQGFELRRGALRFGGGLPTLAATDGITVDGTLAQLRFDEWLTFARDVGTRSVVDDMRARFGVPLREAVLDIADLSGFGQQLGRSTLAVRRGDDRWLIDVDSMPIAGSIALPTGVAGRPAIEANMQRLHLEPRRGGGGIERLDPRRLLGLSLTTESFSYGTRRLGRLRADVRPDPVGLRLVSFNAVSDAMEIDGSGGWFDGPDGSTTRLAFHLSATDVAGALTQLALDPIAEGDMAELTASVYWPGAPSADWTQHLGGDLSLRLETGSLLDIDPGAGRVVGLMSISALPRRLALDFRDVFNKGLVFDEISADFAILDGNAFTDNLKVTGPVAEIGVAGRIGLRDRDYRQQAVVTAEPGKMLPTVGGLIGGPGVGAALLIFTRIFKEPLKGIGRASYCVTGSWEQPVVERLSAEQLERGQLCAELPGQSAAELPGAPTAGTR